MVTGRVYHGGLAIVSWSVAPGRSVNSDNFASWINELAKQRLGQHPGATLCGRGRYFLPRVTSCGTSHVANPEASLAQIFSCVRAWFDTKLNFIKELGGPIIDKTDGLLMSLVLSEFFSDVFSYFSGL